VQSGEVILASPFQRNARILIEQDVLERIRSYRQLRNSDTEAGGILLGYRRLPHIHVVEATTPFRGDRRSRYEFDRRDPRHAQHALQRWQASRGLIDCVGEWHTHPEAHPRPSSLDSSEWRRILSNLSSARIFAIVGMTSEWFGVGMRSRLSEATVAESAEPKLRDR
jgi:integrative and conjugative element protein (TIGR02256 family)